LAGRLSFCGTTWPVWVGLPFRAWFQVARLGCKRSLCTVVLSRPVAIRATCLLHVAFASCAKQLRWLCLAAVRRARRKPPFPGVLLPGRFGVSRFWLTGSLVFAGAVRFGIVSFVVSVACQVSLAFPGCPVLALVVMSGHRWLGRLPLIGANPAIWVCGCLALALFAGLSRSSFQLTDI